MNEKGLMFYDFECILKYLITIYLFVLMRRLFLFINLYITMELLICRDEMGLTLQIDKSVQIPQYNCTLNVSNEKLMNMTSSGGQLKVIGTELLLTQTVILAGFKVVEFQNITIDTLTDTIDIIGPVLLSNVILLRNCQIRSTTMQIRGSQMIGMTYQNTSAFQSPMEIDGLYISDCTFFRSQLSSQMIQLRNVIIDQVSFINSTLSPQTQVNRLTLNNSFVVQSILIETDISQEVTFQNTYLTLSTGILAKGALYTTVLNVTLSQSVLIQLQSENQIKLSSLKINRVISDSQVIVASSQYVYLYNSTITEVESKAFFNMDSQNIFLQQIIISSLVGPLLVSKCDQTNVMLNYFTISNSHQRGLFQIKGAFSLSKGNFNSMFGLIINSQTITELNVDQVEFKQINNSILINLKESSLTQLTNVLIEDCSSIQIAKLETVVYLMIRNLTINNCNECNFLTLNASQADLTHIKMFQISNFLTPLIQALESDINAKGLYLNTITFNNKELITTQNCSKLVLTDLQFTNIDCPQCNGIIVIRQSTHIEIFKSTFKNTQSFSGFISVQDSNNFIAYNSTFTNISANQGSAYVISNTAIKIYGNQFIDLTSPEGGVIYLNQSSGLSHYIQQNLFNNCSMKTDKHIFMLTSEIVEPDILTYVTGPVYLVVNNDSYLFDNLIKRKDIIHKENYKSGQTLELKIAILDSGRNRICDFKNYLAIEEKIFEFDELECQYEVFYTHYQQQPKNETIQVLLEFQSLTFYNDTFKLPIYLSLIQCEIGEEWENQSCLKCPAGSYSLDNFNHCQQCITSIESCPGGSELVLKQGYWRANKTTDSIEYCQSSVSQCLGGSEEFTCSQGYTGALCDDCDYYAEHWNNSYTRGFGGNCTLCQNDVFNIFKIILSFSWILIALFISIRGSLRLVRAQLSAHYLRMMGIFFATRSTMVIDQTEILIKLFSSYFQLISIVQVIDFDFPTPIEVIAQAIGNPLSTLGYSIECFLLNSQLQIEIVYLRQFWNLFVSLLFVFSFVFIYSLIQLCKQSQMENSIKTIFISCLIQVNFYFQGDIIEGLLQLMFCIKASGQYYILAATSYMCYTEEYYLYLKILIIPTLILVGIVSPLFYIIKLYRNKNKLWTCQLRMPYGYLYVEYKDNYYYWEFVCFFIKSLFYLLETLLIQDIKLMFLFAILILLVYLELLNKHHPYIEKQYNFIDKISTQLAMVTLILSYSQDKNPYTSLVYILSILCSVLNLLYCTYIFSKIIREYLSSLKQQHIERIVNLIIRYPCIKYCIKKPKNYYNRRKACLLWKKVRVYVMEFIEKLKLQKSNNNLNQDYQLQSSTHRPNTSSTNTTISLLNSMAPQLLKYIKHNRNSSRVQPETDSRSSKKNLDQNDFNSVVSAYIDPNNSVDAETPQLPKKSTVSSIFSYVVNNHGQTPL
ncbi:unnamed protein product (macronuclear) [Paramecium tetraurelia]|uniref:Transmembrane protein n=1 Tax=Paramecium tetraurelia TaxID=5888 RepID=A0BK15_PARTE|nr:uncharacterized protein GSPATT00029512001 [Paramecium tetraurelia]CAK58882.1 unnamed protein product [Paramecium tetraurelia]|eukprot:XP_001426280.1 hypothetical protein (macronuclear) [Paramecium tetraurelia strain d4-2]